MRTLSNLFATLTLLSIAALPVHARADGPSADAIVVAADAVRNPAEPFHVALQLTDYVGGKPEDHTQLVVHAKADSVTHKWKNVVRYTDPPRDTGKAVLFNGTSMWFYDPSAKASVRISAQQRLTGQASNGDVLTANLATDYTATFISEETISDAERKSRSTYHLNLVAKSTEAVYARLEYWVNKGDFHPVKARFYSDSGRVLKVAYYGKYAPALGGERPTEVVIIDGVDSKLVTKIAYSDYRSEKVDDAWFARDYLPRLAAD